MEPDAVADEELSSKKEKKKRKTKDWKKRRQKQGDAEDETMPSTTNNKKKNGKGKKRNSSVVSLEEPAGVHSRSTKRQKLASVATDSTQEECQTLPAKRHAFDVDQADHCETPFRAYQDILPVLDQIAKSCGKERRNLIIYDPYYCDGGIISKLKSLGCRNVINRNRDFYHDIATGRVPPFDVLLTNPPYSGDHIESLLKFVSRNIHQHSHKHDLTLTPFLLLLPHYVYTKPYFQEYFDSDARGREGQRTVATTASNRQMFYLVPQNNYRYSYQPPSWVNLQTGSTALAKGKTQTAPFPTFWYCHVPSLMVMKTTEPSNSHQQSWLCQTFGQSGKHHITNTPAVAPAIHQPSRLLYANCTVHLPREFKGEFDVTNKRPNPRARKRAAMKKVQQHPSHSTAIL